MHGRRKSKKTIMDVARIAMYEREETTNGDSAANAANQKLKRRISTLMQAEEESTINPVRNNSGKNDGSGDIDDG